MHPKPCTKYTTHTVSDNFIKIFSILKSLFREVGLPVDETQVSLEKPAIWLLSCAELLTESLRHWGLSPQEPGHLILCLDAKRSPNLPASEPFSIKCQKEGVGEITTTPAEQTGPSYSPKFRGKKKQMKKEVRVHANSFFLRPDTWVCSGSCSSSDTQED